MRHSRRGNIDPFIVMDVMEAARAAEAAGRHIIHMEVGQPGTGAPKAALERLARDLTEDTLGYTVGLGLPELRARIAQYYGEKHNVDLDPNRVIVTSGASGAFLLAFSALFDTGNRVGLAAPGYPSYRQILRALDINAVDMPAGFETRFQPQPSDVAKHNLDGLLVASPANPTGSTLSRAEMQALYDACKAQGAALISDEIYHGLSYGTIEDTALQVTDDVVVINSFSKYFSMTGWRVGWMVVPEEMVRPVERIAQNMFICAPHASQKLALYAMDCADELDANVATYAENRRLMIAGLTEAGFDRFPPADGAFYIYADVSKYTDDSRAFAAEILEKAGVAVTPGLDFDPQRGQHWIRFSYARSTADITEGIARLKAFMAAHG